MKVIGVARIELGAGVELPLAIMGKAKAMGEWSGDEARGDFSG